MDTHTITSLINDYGYLAVALLIALENIFPPIPSEVILTFAGFITLTSTLTIWGVILAATIGSVSGAAILYGVGLIASPSRMKRLVTSRAGRWLHVKPRDIDRAIAFFNRHGGKAIVYGRFIPVVRSLVSIPAGMAKFPFWLFVGLSTLGTAIWNTVLINAGCLAGTHWPLVLSWFEKFSTVVFIVVAIAVVIGIVWYRVKLKRSRVND